jgi:hypothetical protein
MSSFACDVCGLPIIENQYGVYITGCNHYPLDVLNADKLYDGTHIKFPEIVIKRGGGKMSKARDRYEKLVDDIPEDSTMGEAIRNYVTELESEIKNLMVTTNALLIRCDVLESDKAELIKVINMLISKSTKGGWIETLLSPVLKKHGVEI